MIQHNDPGDERPDADAQADTGFERAERHAAVAEALDTARRVREEQAEAEAARLREQVARLTAAGDALDEAIVAYTAYSEHIADSTSYQPADAAIEFGPQMDVLWEMVEQKQAAWQQAKEAGNG